MPLAIVRYLFLLPAWLLFAATAQAFDTTTQGVVISAYVTSQVTTAPFDKKLIADARDDAAVFVASEGRDRGARLEAALQGLRHNAPSLNVSDLELARAILVQ